MHYRSSRSTNSHKLRSASDKCNYISQTSIDPLRIDYRDNRLQSTRTKQVWLAAVNHQTCPWRFQGPSDSRDKLGQHCTSRRDKNREELEASLPRRRKYADWTRSDNDSCAGSVTVLLPKRDCCNFSCALDTARLFSTLMTDHDIRAENSSLHYAGEGDEDDDGNRWSYTLRTTTPCGDRMAHGSTGDCRGYRAGYFNSWFLSMRRSGVVDGVVPTFVRPWLVATRTNGIVWPRLSSTDPPSWC